MITCEHSRPIRLMSRRFLFSDPGRSETVAFLTALCLWGLGQAAACPDRRFLNSGESKIYIDYRLGDIYKIFC